MQFVGFTPNFASFTFQFGFGHRDHSKKKLCLARFFSAYTDSMLKIRPRYPIVRFAIVCTHARPRAYQLVDQTIVHRAPCYLFGKKNHGLAKSGRSLF